MSFQAMTWATAQQLPALQKLVLLMLANCCNHHTGQCNPKIKTLAAECGMSETACKNAIKALSDAGHVKIIPEFHLGVQLPNSYELTMGGVSDTRGVGRQTPGGGSPDAPGVGRQTPTNEPTYLNQELKLLLDAGVDTNVAQDWLRIRKAKKAPLTETAWEGVKREAAAAGMTAAQAVKHATENNWQGFRAAWLKGPNGSAPTADIFAGAR
jgi:biotin operon repressor